MARTRSPAYPGIPLHEAVEFARRIYDNDHRYKIPRDVAALHLGFKSLHGSAMTALAALRHYGLLDSAQGSFVAILQLLHVVAMRCYAYVHKAAATHAQYMHVASYREMSFIVRIILDYALRRQLEPRSPT